MSKSPSLRRIQADIRELARDPSDRYYAAPLENDMFEWHFTIRGADKTDFEGGVYHGRIMLPAEYPFKPPHIIFLTPSGRFETNTKVCLSFSAYHPELWQPAWGIRLILEALISFLPTPADGAIGALDWTSAERKRLAKASVNYHCAACGCKAIELLPELKAKSEEEEEDAVKAKKNKKAFMFQKEIEKLQQLQSLEHAQKEMEEGGSATAAAAKTSTDDEGITTDEGAKETEKKPVTEENSVDKEPALVVDDASASGKVKFSETTTPSPKPTTPKDADTQEKSTTNTTSSTTTATSATLDNSELERACREDPETIRRQLLQGATPCSLRGEKRVEFEQRRIRQYYEHILKAGREIDWEAKARFEKEQEEHRAKEQEFEQQEALELAAQKVLEAQQRAVQEEQQQQQEPHHVPLVQERLDGPVPPRQEQIPQMQQPAVPAQDDLFSWILDPVLHGIIATLAVLCFLLLRKLQGMVAELNDLNELLEKA